MTPLGAENHRFTLNRLKTYDKMIYGRYKCYEITPSLIGYSEKWRKLSRRPRVKFYCLLLLSLLNMFIFVCLLQFNERGMTILLEHMNSLVF